MAVQTSPFKAAGTTLSSKATSGGTYAPQGQLIDLEYGGVTTGEIDTTILAATVKTNIPSIPDSGDLTLSTFYVPGDTTVESLATQANAPTIQYWQIQCPDGSSPTTGSTATFNAWVSSFAPKGFTVDGSPVADVTLRITGAVTYAVGT